MAPWAGSFTNRLRRRSEPLFSVVVPCFGRGEHILPTIASALEQTLADFELLVVTDGPDQLLVARLGGIDPRLRVLSLRHHSGSQSAPNNLGLANARGRYVAYLGHDDVWAPGHLHALHRCFIEKGCDVAVSGCIYHGPDGVDLNWITGLFDDPEAARSHFFPPTSFAHTRRLMGAVPCWYPPDMTVAAVDADFILRAVQRGALCASTGAITAHKFAAGHRYLSYLEPASTEQEAMLHRLRGGTVDGAHLAAVVDRAREAGTFMVSRHPDFGAYRPGELFRMNRSNKGIDRAITVPLSQQAFVPVQGEPRALDWHRLETPGGTQPPFRWSGPSLRPRILVPFMGDSRARLTLHLGSFDPADNLRRMRIRMNDAEIERVKRHDTPQGVDLAFVAPLRPGKASVVQLILPDAYCPDEHVHNGDHRRIGIMLMGFSIAPD